MFRFRLQKVLQHRRRLRDGQARRLHLASENLAHIRDSQQAIESRIEEQMTQAAAERHVQADLRLWQQRSDYLRALQRQRTGLEEQQLSAVAKVAAERAKLIQSHRDVDVLERLKEQQRAAWLRDEERRERKKMDEIGSQRNSQAAKSQLP